MAKSSAFGTKLRFIDPSEGTLTRILHVADISGPEVNVETVDVTTHDSPEGFAQFVPGLADGGVLEFDIMFDGEAANHRRILEMIEARETVAFSLLLPRPDGQLIEEPEFEATTGWNEGSNWTISDGCATYGSATPSGDALLTEDIDLIQGEEYLVRVKFRGVGTGQAQISFAGGFVGDLDPVAGGTQDFRFVPESAAGALEILIDIGSPSTAFALESVHLFGLNDDSEGRFDFPGVFTKAGILLPVRDAQKATVAVKVSGKPQYTLLT